jgi:arylsulfatase A
VWKDPALEGQRPLLEGTVTLPGLLKKYGYTTGAMGKWGLGGPDSTGQPNRQGFDHWYGYLCQRQAHFYYPTHLWRDTYKHLLRANDNGKEGAYSHDLIVEEALGFIRNYKDKPFFLYLPFTIPHVSLQVPADSLAEYEDAWEETPYKGGHYTAHPKPNAAYAAMITRMDRDVGRIMDLLKELGLDEKTLVIFTSDNGPTWAGGVDAEFFNSAGPLRGLKGSLYEGGIRVPFVARWPGRIEAGGTSDLQSAFWDMLPTFMELAGGKNPAEGDGISMLPTLLGNGEKQKPHEYLYWEHGRKQALRKGDWKAVRLKPDKPLELYNLKVDLGEKTDLAKDHPDKVKEMEALMKSARTESELFPLK